MRQCGLPLPNHPLKRKNLTNRKRFSKCGGGQVDKTVQQGVDTAQTRGPDQPSWSRSAERDTAAKTPAQSSHGVGFMGRFPGGETVRRGPIHRLHPDCLFLRALRDQVWRGPPEQAARPGRRGMWRNSRASPTCGLRPRENQDWPRGRRSVWRCSRRSE